MIPFVPMFVVVTARKQHEEWDVPRGGRVYLEDLWPVKIRTPHSKLKREKESQLGDALCM